MADLQLRIFVREDFPEYQSWFTDPDLNAQLGPMTEDDEWLEAVLNRQDGIEYSVFRDQELVAMLGVDFPHAKHTDYFITDLAVKPSLRGQGIGSQTLQKLFKLHPLASGQRWRAYVNVHNPRVIKLLERLNWICESETPSEFGMLSFVYAEP